MNHADLVAAECLLRCWAREQDAQPHDGVLHIPLRAAGTSVAAPVTYWSATGWHRFGPPAFPSGAEVDPVTLAALLTHDLGVPPADDDLGLVARVADSTRRIRAHHAHRREHQEEPAGSTPFLAAEQALLDGHPWHPAPKSRDGLTDAEAAAYSPELRGSFALHWFAADPELVAHDSATGTPVAGAFGRTDDGKVLVPAHPWQARDALTRPSVRELLDEGHLRALGPSGPAWHATSSVRTVYRPDAATMLKLSLGMRITNSRRENLREELLRGTEISRLIDAGLGAWIAAAHPTFRILRDPGWIAVQPHETGLNAVVRENPFGAKDRACCLAGLTAAGVDGGDSVLATVVHDLANRLRRTTADVATEWLARYLEVVVVPVLWLYATYGLAVEAHQQNTVVTLDADGWPAGGWYRDNQGYYLSETRAASLTQLLPGLGEHTDILTADDVIDERLTYYLGVNNLLGLVGAFGSSGLAEEEHLLPVARTVLRRMAEVTPVAESLIETKTLRCKANMLTRVHGLDELVGPVESQSVYVDIANPLVETR